VAVSASPARARCRRRTTAQRRRAAQALSASGAACGRAAHVYAARWMKGEARVVMDAAVMFRTCFANAVSESTQPAMLPAAGVQSTNAAANECRYNREASAAAATRRDYVRAQSANA